MLIDIEFVAVDDAPNQWNFISLTTFDFDPVCNVAEYQQVDESQNFIFMLSNCTLEEPQEVPHNVLYWRFLIETLSVPILAWRDQVPIYHQLDQFETQLFVITFHTLLR